MKKLLHLFERNSGVPQEAYTACNVRASLLNVTKIPLNTTCENCKRTDRYQRALETHQTARLQSRTLARYVRRKEKQSHI